EPDLPRRGSFDELLTASREHVANPVDDLAPIAVRFVEGDAAADPQRRERFEPVVKSAIDGMVRSPAVRRHRRHLAMRVPTRSAIRPSNAPCEVHLSSSADTSRARARARITVSIVLVAASSETTRVATAIET